MRTTAKKLVLSIAVALPVAASAFAATGWVTSRPVGSVRVAGEFTNVSARALRAVVMQVIDGGFFGVDVDAVRAAAMSLPYVREVTVRRVWPDSLHIAVVERRAVARWNETGLLEDDGGMFVPRGAQGHEDLAQLQGPEGEHARVLASYKRLTAGLGSFASGLRRLSLSARGDWELEFANGLVLIPRTPLDAAELEDMVGMLPRLLGDELARVERIDLRYPNGFAVRWRAPLPDSDPARAAETRG